MESTFWHSKGVLCSDKRATGCVTMIDNLLGSGATRIIVNLKHVNYVDSAGLGALIEMHRKTKAKGGGLKLCNLGPNLRQALEIARLLPIFETCRLKLRLLQVSPERVSSISDLVSSANGQESKNRPE